MDPSRKLHFAGQNMVSSDVRKNLIDPVLPYLNDTDLHEVRHWVDKRIDFLSRASAGEEWWVLQLGKQPEEILTDGEKCLVLGIKHMEHNPTGEAQKINCIKSLRARMECGLKEAKELAEEYALRVRDGDAEMPVFTTLAEEYSAKTEEDEDDIFGELI